MILLLSFLLVAFIVCAVFTIDTISFAILGAVAVIAGLDGMLLLRKKSPELAACAGVAGLIIGCILSIAAYSNPQKGGRLDYEKDLGTLWEASAGADLERMETVNQAFTDKYGNLDTAGLAYADCYLNVAENEEDEGRKAEYKRAASDLLDRVVDTKSQDYYLVKGHLLEFDSKTIAHMLSNHWIDAIKTYPTWDTAHLMAGLAILDETGNKNLQLAQYYLFQAIELNPDNALANAYMGITSYEQGYYEHAEGYLQCAKDLSEEGDYASELAAYYLNLVKEAGR